MAASPTEKPLRLILASASPRRRELLAGLGCPFEVISPRIDETPWANEAPANFALRMAHEKAMAVVVGLPTREPVRVIAADTIVVLGRMILGKPANAAEAEATLRLLSGQRHHVITGLCVWTRDAAGFAAQGEAVHTEVVFNAVSDDAIRAYVATGEPMDKAGSYAIQGGAAGMVAGIDGSYTNVVGLPMEALARLLG
ncbi:MAG TPA: Maf family protein [Kiritimatiellia bacterium]|nr:Maf family protein [Kiritimatiellia bacterium]HMP33254.1 Maf family protein [Kiritimatiellia bacterium]